MSVYPCPYLEEIVILCDGRITTCCVDSTGVNTYANIYTQGAEEVLQIYKMVKQKYIEDYRQLPRCKGCVEAQLHGKGFIKPDPSPQEVDKFVKKSYSGRYVIELTAVCNLKCIGCIQSNNVLKKYRIDGNLFIDVNKLIQWFNPIIQSVRNVRLYNYGETFLHPDSLDFCYYLTHHTTFGADIHVSTNGYLLDSKFKISKLLKAQLNALLFSIHGGTQESLEKYMTKAANLEKVMKIMKEILQMRDELGLFLPRIYWKCLLFEWNDSDYEMEMVRQLAEDVGVDAYYFELAVAPYP